MGELCLNPFSGRVLAGDHSALLGQSSETSRHRRQRERLGHGLSLCRDYGKVGGVEMVVGTIADCPKEGTHQPQGPRWSWSIRCVEVAH